MLPNSVAGEKGLESEMNNWRPIVVARRVCRIFTAMMTQWIQDQGSFNKLAIFSRCQKGFVQWQAGCREHIVLTREMISHATKHRRDLHMVQIHFSNAFSSVPNDLIVSNMRAICEEYP